MPGVWLETVGLFVPRVVTSRSTEVLGIYRTILQTAAQWKQVELDRDPTSSEVRKRVQSERQYIRWEAKRLFKRNKNITSVERIDRKIFEATSRLELANHYQIPYPRKWQQLGSGEEHEDPAYMDSYLPFDTGVDFVYLRAIGAEEVAFTLPPY